jgi:hypothetical protein
MRKVSLLFMFAYLATSCVNYYNVTVNADTVLYSSGNDGSSVAYSVPSGSSVYIKGKKSKKYRKIKYENYAGWAYYPNYTASSNYSSSSSSSSFSSTRSSSNYSSPGKTVNVKGYYRKNGTYVRPHTRSSPGSGRRRY